MEVVAHIESCVDYTLSGGDPEAVAAGGGGEGSGGDANQAPKSAAEVDEGGGGGDNEAPSDAASLKRKTCDETAQGFDTRQCHGREANVGHGVHVTPSVKLHVQVVQAEFTPMRRKVLYVKIVCLHVCVHVVCSHVDSLSKLKHKIKTNK